MFGEARSDLGGSGVAIDKAGTFKIHARPGSVDVRSTDPVLA